MWFSRVLDLPSCAHASGSDCLIKPSSTLRATRDSHGNHLLRRLISLAGPSDLTKASHLSAPPSKTRRPRLAHLICARLAGVDRSSRRCATWSRSTSVACPEERLKPCITEGHSASKKWPKNNRTSPSQRKHYSSLSRRTDGITVCCAIGCVWAAHPESMKWSCWVYPTHDV